MKNKREPYPPPYVVGLIASSMRTIYVTQKAIGAGRSVARTIAEIRRDEMLHFYRLGYSQGHYETLRAELIN